MQSDNNIREDSGSINKLTTTGHSKTSLSNNRPYSKITSFKNSPFMGTVGTGDVLNEFLDLDTLAYENINEDDDEGFEKKSEFGNAEEAEREIEFTMRIPQNLHEYIKEFEKLKARQTELLNN